MESLAPFLQGTCTPYNMPVYPGAQCKIAESLIDILRTSHMADKSALRPSGLDLADLSLSVASALPLRGLEDRLSTDRLFPVFHRKLTHCDVNLLQVSWCFFRNVPSCPKKSDDVRGESEDEIIFSCVGNVVGNIGYWRHILLIFQD